MKTIQVLICICFLIIGFALGNVYSLINSPFVNTPTYTFEWESLQSDIPKQPEYIKITGIVDNVVYLSPIDE